jgi:GT2 family glycosyltransferase
MQVDIKNMTVSTSHQHRRLRAGQTERMTLSVIIPSRNTDNLVACVSAVRKHEPSVRIVVVDDGLDLRRLAVAGQCWACSNDPLRIVEGVKPFIYARNCNLGIGAAGGSDVVLLNDDALLRTPLGLSAMQCSCRPEYGVVGATCNNVGNRNQWPQRIGLREDPRMVCFTAVLIPRRTIDAVGLLDERFVGYGCDDDDYCLRVRKAGLKIGIHDGCYVDHGSLVSTFRGGAAAGGDFGPNLELFKQKWGHDNWGNHTEVLEVAER